MRPWDELNADEKKLFARLAEVYAGFSEYTDAQVGRIIEYLENTGQLENTVVFYAADNGASGEGSPNGSVNENKFFNGYPDDLEENMKLFDKLGGPNTYEHYPTGWAAAFSTPFKMFKRYSYAGGTCRSAGHLLAEGDQGPGRGARPVPPLPPTSCRRFSIAAASSSRSRSTASSRCRCPACRCATASTPPSAPTHEEDPVLRMLGTRGIWQDGWKAVDRARTDLRPRALRPGRVGALPRSKWTAPSRTNLGPGEPREAEAHDRAVVQRGRASTTCCRSTTGSPIETHA